MNRGQTKKLGMSVFITLLSVTLVACGSNDKESGVAEIPQNNQEKNITDVSKDTNEANDVDSELENADLTGAVTEVTTNGAVISQATDDGETEEGDTVMHSTRGENQVTVEFTEKTEFKRLITKNQKDGCLEKGSKSDVATESGLLLYGSYAGSKFIATKVIVTVNE